MQGLSSALSLRTPDSRRPTNGLEVAESELRLELLNSRCADNRNTKIAYPAVNEPQHLRRPL